MNNSIRHISTTAKFLYLLVFCFPSIIASVSYTHLKFKKSLKANLIRNDRNTRVWLRLLKDAQSLQEFLLNNPFIFFAKDGQPHRAVFLEAKEH